MQFSGLDQLAAGGASVLAGAINAIAGGGTLISFPTLVGIGVPAVGANVTNTVALVPGYLGGSYAQRRDLASQMSSARTISVVGGAGGLAGSVLLVVIPGHAFRLAVPYLILLSCALLLIQQPLRRRLLSRRTEQPAAAADAGGESHPRLMVAMVFLAGVYGGFFGGGLGIMLLAVLGLFSHDPLPKVNALKQALSFLINLLAALFFLFSGQVYWALVPVMAAGAVVGGVIGGRLVHRIPEQGLRVAVVLAGVAVAVALWVSG